MIIYLEIYKKPINMGNYIRFSNGYYNANRFHPLVSTGRTLFFDLSFPGMCSGAPAAVVTPMLDAPGSSLIVRSQAMGTLPVICTWPVVAASEGRVGSNKAARTARHFFMGNSSSKKQPTVFIPPLHCQLKIVIDILYSIKKETSYADI